MFFAAFLWIFYFYVRSSTLLHLLPLRFHCVGGCWDRTQDCCDFGIDSRRSNLEVDLQSLFGLHVT